jgi:hypothetical protein
VVIWSQNHRFRPQLFFWGPIEFQKLVSLLKTKLLAKMGVFTPCLSTGLVNQARDPICGELKKKRFLA